MSANSAIEWTDATWNPVRGCTKISPGCFNCYAERFRGVNGHPFEQGFDLRLAPWKLTEPLHWAKPQMVFVNSMSDLFHADVPDSYIVSVFGVMAQANWHVYQVLTKRADRMRRMAAKQLKFATELGHIWWGTTVENRKHGLPRLAALQETEAAVRFLSCEPLLEDLGTLDLRRINWLIAGGESGPGARPIEKGWVTSLRDQCKAAHVPFFFKQWGGFPKSKLGSALDGREHKEVPPLPVSIVPTAAERLAIKTKLHGSLGLSVLGSCA